MPRLLAIVAIAGALVVVGCGGDGSDMESPAIADEPASETEDGAAGADEASDRKPEREGERPGRDPEAKPSAPPGTEISTSDSQFGAVLFDGDDQAIYYFEPEKTSEPRCYGECAEAWPPVLTRGDPEATGGARQRLLDTTERRDGSLQVTYDGRPLYYYFDEGPGELRCHNVFHAGGLWLAVQPGGEPVPH